MKQISQKSQHTNLACVADLERTPVPSEQFLSYVRLNCNSIIWKRNRKPIVL